MSPQKSLYLSFSPCKATNLTTRCHCKQSLLILFHHAKLQILLHGVTANSLCLSFFTKCKATTILLHWCHPFHKLQSLLIFTFSPCKATSLTTRCHRKQSLLYPFHLVATAPNLQYMCHRVNSLYLSFLHHAFQSYN